MAEAVGEQTSGVGWTPSALRNRKFRCGEVITQAPAFSHVISMKVNGKYCDWCALPPSESTVLRMCTSCHYEHYCDKKCQKKAWKYHKFECPLIKARFPQIPADGARLLTKILWNIGHGIDRVPGDPGWRVWKDLCHNLDGIKADALRSRQFMQLSHTVVQYVGPENMRKNGICIDADTLFDFGRMVFNGFTLTHMCEEIGAAVFISPSIFNHSCSPNAIHLTIGTTVYIRAIADIDTSKESIFVNYIDPMQPRQARQSELLKDYYFECKCTKCLDTNTEASLESIVCPQCQGNFVKRDINDFICLDCHNQKVDMAYVASCEESVAKIAQLCNEALKKTNTNINTLRDFVESSSKLLTKRNVNLAMLKYTLYSVVSEKGSDSEAYQLGEELTGLFKLFYPKVYPTYGAHQLKQARLAWHLEKYEEALNHYRCAVTQLLVTHGPRHPMTVTAQSDIPQCEHDHFMFRREQM